MVDSTAYIKEPPWARWLQMVLYILLYVCMGVAGFAAVTQLGSPAHEAGYAMMAGALFCLVGVTTRFYHLELVGLWPLLTGLAFCVVWLVIPPQNAILTGWLVGGFMPGLAARLLVLNLLANKARREAELA
jgi:hypothetical protein